MLNKSDVEGEGFLPDHGDLFAGSRVHYLSESNQRVKQTEDFLGLNLIHFHACRISAPTWNFCGGGGGNVKKLYSLAQPHEETLGTDGKALDESLNE